MNKYLKFNYPEDVELKFFYTEADKLLHIVFDGKELALRPENVVNLVKFLQEKPEFDKQERCPSCNERLAKPEHLCPYKQDLYDDEKTLCKCCNGCRDNCIKEI